LSTARRVVERFQELPRTDSVRDTVQNVTHVGLDKVVPTGLPLKQLLPTKKTKTW